jgi:acyl-CoA reductase-like NAD-dependent aldehyde dehydrogenase
LSLDQRNPYRRSPQFAERGGGSGQPVAALRRSPTWTNGHTIAQEEIFGPVLPVIPYSSDDDAVAIANATEDGLGGSVWTTDPDRGEAVARRVASGTVGVNAYSAIPQLLR